MAYVTDTTAKVDASYVAELKDVDLLLHECNFTDDMHEWAVKTGHSTTTAVAEVAKKANVGRLVMVHVNPLGDERDPVNLAAAKKIFPKTTIGWDNEVVEF